MISIDYFDISIPILGIKRTTIGNRYIHYYRETNPISNKLIRSGWYFIYLTKLINEKKKK